MSLALIITRQDLPDGLLKEIANRYPEPWDFNLFFVDLGAHLAADPLDDLPRQMDRIVCSFSHQYYKAATPTDETEPGSLMDLGNLIGSSHQTLSVPCVYWPEGRSAHADRKDLALVIRPEATPDQIKQTFRAAAALASRQHQLAVYQPGIEIPGAPAVAEAFRETLADLKGEILPLPEDLSVLKRHEAVLEY